MSSAYDHEPRSSAGKFLRLTAKDQSVIVRLASEPYREPKVWREGIKAPMEDDKVAALTPDQWVKILRETDYRVSEVYSWAVIDRTDGKARIFSGAPSVYKNIKAYAQMEEWGDPTTYDIKITRTEDPGKNYYTVIAMPDKSFLNEKDQLMVEALDIETDLPNARLTSEDQVDKLGEEFQPSPSDENVDLPADDDFKPKKEDVVIEDIPEGEVSLDDIPF